MEGFFVTFFLLLFVHFLGDFSLQNDFVAKAKNPTLAPIEVWPIVLTAHAMVHAGLVYLVVHSIWLTLIQLVTHIVIDYSKCKGYLGTKYSFLVDQLLHVAVALFIAITYYLY